jgi:hypothetical protein
LRVTKSNICVFPSSKFGTSTVEPYNAGLYLGLGHSDSCDITFSFDNKSLYDHCTRAGLDDPKLLDINQLIAQTVSAISLGARFQGIFFLIFLLHVNFTLLLVVSKLHLRNANCNYINISKLKIDN